MDLGAACVAAGVPPYASLADGGADNPTVVAVRGGNVVGGVWMAGTQHSAVTKAPGNRVVHTAARTVVVDVAVGAAGVT